MSHCPERIPDAPSRHWVNRTPARVRPFLQLSRLDRPVGYWLLALPGWVGLLLPCYLCRPGWDPVASPLLWGALILIGAIAMRGAGCTYNDIVDRELDAKVERTRSRPLPSGRVSVKQAWGWLFAQVGIGFLVWLALPLSAKLVALASLPLVAAYPFMKRITGFPQVWLGLTFNWAVLVAYSVKAGGLHASVLLVYAGLAAWTVGYDTIYAMQDAEDDALAGIKSTALTFGSRVRAGVAVSYAVSVALVTWGLLVSTEPRAAWAVVPFAAHLLWQVVALREERALGLFKSNGWACVLLVVGLVASQLL